MQNDISFLIGLKNNLEYTRFFYRHVRSIYPEVEIVFVSYGSTDGTHQWLDQLDDSFLKYFYSEESKTLSDTYNKAAEIATKKNICFLHNDMVLGNFFLENLSRDMVENELNFYKVIEPPIFTGDFRDWKETHGFGDDIHSFDFQQFFDFEKTYISEREEAVSETAHTSFFLCVRRKVLLEIGGLDNLFNPMFCEDDDLIIRLRLLGLKTMQLHRALVYHFVSKTSRFSEEYENKTKTIELKSQRNFIRKWGVSNGPVLPVKYDIGIIVKNGNLDTLYRLEHFANTIYVDFPFDDYIVKEQVNTKYDLRERIKPISQLQKHDVIIHLNGKAANQKTMNMIENISHIIFENKSKYINPSVFQKLFLKVFKPYRPLIFFKEAPRKEKLLIYKELF
ncbi:GT2 family glycosyltransferase [Chryseobacterium sp. SORGH_AS 447]|uniref:glycosyltransferase family 2 protein n=1 Tax=Chryseobacterium sp. SORGH_AS_0447 TaxID=3041769 RepID=UPI00277F05EC|nr:glycosyltransferase [Chryseobacterium sp. SORGH_AS_0447]MDQ1160522.1 GT2 family glycosyltransferase [Chryseobacterium sp. SORGH_AS_0447]